MTISPETRAELRRLDRLATKGPWVASNHLDRIITVETGEESLFDRSDVAQLIMDKASDRLRVESDAALIVAMRNNLIPLLDALEAAEAERDRLREESERLRADMRRLLKLSRERAHNSLLETGERIRAADYVKAITAALGEQP